MHFTARDICDATGIPAAGLNALLQREQLVPAAGRPGSGKAIEFTGSDAIQAAFILALRSAKVALARAPMFWRVVMAQSDPLQVRLYVLECADGTDTGFKISLTAERPADVPAEAACVDVGDLARQVIDNLEVIEARRLAGSASEYPWRQPFLSPEAGKPWEVFIARSAGEPDAETVAAIADAIEARRNILAVSHDQVAHASLCLAIYRVLVASETPAVAPLLAVH